MSLSAQLASLSGDDWREKNPFSPEIATVAEVLLHPYAREDERQLAIKAWLFKHQPCVFGQAAAKANRLYIVVITEKIIAEGEEAIRERLALEKRIWKQWSLEADGKHGLLVVFASAKLHYAAPNDALKKVSEYLRSTFVRQSEKDPAGNDICHEWLYLKRPVASDFVKFRVILDYFASAGDRRWWHDHRFPGGIAFTLNSLGHMVRTKEWYENLKNPVEWATRLAMLTISNAFDHPEFGKATHLLELRDGKPLKSHGCPFADPKTLPERLKEKDWTTYSGSHHTDHSIRREFFDQRPAPDRERGDYLLDFVYLAGAVDGENAELTTGVPVSEAEVFQDVGKPESWRRRKPAQFESLARSSEADRQIEKALAICKQWFQ